MTDHIKAATAYAEGFQNLELGYYSTNNMTQNTQEAIDLLANHLSISTDLFPTHSTIKTINNLLCTT
ncbi:hypothetical protein AGMMS49992_28950 [Clostridia bacterium]|nr:hypothetical protein AGMMS49992_28950 [Clostridia bacterium]